MTKFGHSIICVGREKEKKDGELERKKERE
jgi:hypothetical protein